MTWTANPNNMLLVDNGIYRQPDFIGWYALPLQVQTDFILTPSPNLLLGAQDAYLLPSSSLSVNQGLQAGPGQNILRNGNGNDTLTLSARQAISSHQPDIDGRFPTRFAVTAGNTYTLGLTATGINGSKFTSTVALKMLWIASDGSNFAVSSQGIIANFGQKIRNSVTAIAPPGTVGLVVIFATDLAATLSYPTLNVGAVDIRTGDPTESGAGGIFPDGSMFPGNSNFPSDLAPTVSSNLFYYDPGSSAKPWLNGWKNQLGNPIGPVNDILSVPAGSEARLYFQEDQQVPSIMGMPVTPNTEYAFGISEIPGRTNSQVITVVYDITGTITLATVGNTTDVNRIRTTFATPPNAAWASIKIIGGSTDTQFNLPTFVQGLNTDPLPPAIYGNVQNFWTFTADTRNIVAVRPILRSDSLQKITKSYQFVSDTLSRAGLNSLQSRSDSLATIHTQFTFVADSNTKVLKSFQSISDQRRVVSIRFVASTDSVQSGVSKNVVFTSDTQSKVSKAFVLRTDTLQIVGRATPTGGLLTGLGILSGPGLVSDASDYVPSKIWNIKSDTTNLVHKTVTLVSDVEQTSPVGIKSYTFTSDSLGKVNKSFVVTSDSLGKVNHSYTLKSDTTQILSKTFIIASDNAIGVHKDIVFRSDNNGIVHDTTIFSSDTTKTISIRFTSITTVNPRRSRHIITSRPLDRIGAL